MAMDLKPVGWTVLVEEFKRTDVTPLIIPDSSKEMMLLRHVVVAVGDPRVTTDGREVPIPVKVGDEVLFNTSEPRRLNPIPSQLVGGRILAVIDCECIKGVYSGEPDKMYPKILKPAQQVLVH